MYVLSTQWTGAIVREMIVLSYVWTEYSMNGCSRQRCDCLYRIGVAFFYAISVAWSVRTGQLAAGGVASVWRSWVRSPPGPRWFIGSFVGLYAFPCARASKLNQQIVCMDWVPSDWVQSPMRWVFVSYVRIEFPVTRCSRQWGECLYHIYGLSTQWLGAVANEVSVCIICMDWVPSD